MSTDLRTENWVSIQPQLVGDRLRVYEAWLMWGPCTTRQLAEKTGIDILTLRPRTTELYQLELLVVECGGREKTFRAIPRTEWETRAARNGLPVQTVFL